MMNRALRLTSDDIVLPEALALRGAVIDAFQTFLYGALRNRNTRRAYKYGAEQFLTFAASQFSIDQLDTIKPAHISAWLDAMTARGMAAPSVKQRLAGLTTLFDFLTAQQILARNPARLVHGPSHVTDKGTTPVLTGEEMLQLLNAIDTTTLIGKRDRAMIAMMAYSFARISSITSMKVQHVFHQKRRLWLRITGKRGKRQDIPCHHQLDAYLVDWLDAAGHGSEPDAWLFPTFANHGRRLPASSADADIHGAVAGNKPLHNARPLSSKPMTQAMTWEMLQRRKKQAGLHTAICNHTFRATGITAYLSHGGGIERAAIIAGHSSINTTKLYDRRSDDVSLDEIEKIRFA